MSRHRISSVIRLSYWCVTNYVLSQQRFPMNIWQNKFRVPLHEEPLNYLVRATATAQSSPLSCWGTKRDKDASWANGGAVFVFVFNVAFVVVFVAVFGGGQRETKMQVGQTAALAVLSSNQRNLFDSQFTLTSFRSLAETSRFPLAFLSIECPI